MRGPEGNFGRTRYELPQGEYDGLRLVGEQLLTSNNEVLEGVGRKLLELVRLKELADYVMGDDPTNDYRRLKKVGLFLLEHVEVAQLGLREEKEGMTVTTQPKKRDDYDRVCVGDEVLQLHLPPVKRGKFSLSNIRKSFARAAEYIEANVVAERIEPQGVLAVTYPQLGQLLEKVGFESIEVPLTALPSEQTRGIQEVYARHSGRFSDDKPLTSIWICYASTEDFIGISRAFN